MTEKVFINIVFKDVLFINTMSAGKMFRLVVCILTSVAYSEGGYFHENLPLGIQSPLTVNSDILDAQLLPRSVNYAIREVPEKNIAYSISFDDYLYLKRHKVEGQDSPYNPDPYGPVNEPVIVNRNGRQSLRHVKHDIVHCTDNPQKRSTETNSINGYIHPLVSATVEPVVQKHVYFHVPPPDFEDPPVIPRVVQSSNKKINIVFIKAPTFKPNYTPLYQFYHSHQAPAEDKTLIYVLSKKEDALQHVVLPPKPLSVPEVFFVNYKFNANDLAPRNSEVLPPSVSDNVLPVLKLKSAELHP